LTEQTTHPDPYATTPGASPGAFPTQDLYEVRPKGGTLRRGRGWLLVAGVVLAIVGIIASDKWSKSKTAVASQPVTAYGVGNIPLKDMEIKETPVDATKPEEKKVAVAKPPPAPPPRKGGVLGRSDAFENPSQKYAEREVASWNASPGRVKGNESIANPRRTVLGR
jgi:hypothetical protein